MSVESSCTAYEQTKGKSKTEKVIFLSGFSENTKYTEKTDIIHYKPTGKKPEIGELINEGKTLELLKEILFAKVSTEERLFLIKAACRHLAFNYRKIAEYYASANKEMQELMEKSALVIIDYDDAIKNGYVRLSKRIREMSDSDA